MGVRAGKLISGGHVDAPVAPLTFPDIYPPFWWQPDIYLKTFFGIYIYVTKKLKIKPLRNLFGWTLFIFYWHVQINLFFIFLCKCDCVQEGERGGVIWYDNTQGGSTDPWSTVVKIRDCLSTASSSSKSSLSTWLTSSSGASWSSSLSSSSCSRK